MRVRNGLSRSIAQVKRDYDEVCKRILAEPQVRARILKDYVHEFSGMSVTAIEGLLGGEVEIGAEPVDHDSWAARTTGQDLNVEDVTVAEGTVRFDVRFSAEVPGGTLVEIDLEAQSKWSVGYPLPSRAVFYCARMLSAQGGQVLPRSEYGKLRKVYSVWVCSHPDRLHKGVVEHFTIRPHGKSGECLFGGYNLMEVCFVCLDARKATPEHGCLGLLSLLFATSLPPAEVRRALEEDFGMMLTEEIDEGVEAMCNFSEGIWEDGRAEGIAEGKAEALRNLMANLGMTIEAAMGALGIPADERAEYESLVTALG